MALQFCYLQEPETRFLIPPTSNIFGLELKQLNVASSYN